MPRIDEEDEVAAVRAPADFADLLYLPEPAFTSSGDVLSATAVAGLEQNDFLHDGALEEWDLSAPAGNSYGLDEPDYGKFENWIPQFVRPEEPCDYCRSRRLNCYMTRGEISCTSCNVLFRECSLSNTQTLERLNAATGHLLDTLHIVDEDVCKEQGTFTGVKPLASKNSTSVRPDDAPGSTKRNGIRFPRAAVKILREWLESHADNPYPTEKQKAELESRTELKSSQIANWLANARRRRKVTERAKKPLSSPSLRPSTPAIDIPVPDKPWDELNPFERWKNSPPENEPASITDIAHAVANSDLPDDDQISTSPSSAGRRKHRSKGSIVSHGRPASTTSFETGQTSASSTSAAWSQGSSQSHGSFSSFGSGLAGKKDRRRRRRPAMSTLKKPSDEKRRTFQCTFCTDTFKSKYDWTRHEKSLHLSLEKWICAPLGPVITDPTTGNKRCVYCSEQDPSDEHVESHNYRQCEEKGLDARTFYRKDHLRQHLRLMHQCEMVPFMDTWKSVAVNINSRCGFCAKRFTTWQGRVDHLTAHFKAGAKMSEWKGCRGLDPAVAAQVTNAMPPYLIGIESVSPIPFSANQGTWRSHVGQIPARDMDQINAEDGSNRFEEEAAMTGLPVKATCWEILTVRLGKYANEMSQKGITITDEMLQAHARRILYDDDDKWNQTAADNPEWLDLFKKAHGLNFIPSEVGAQGQKIPEDLETYQDLGLRVPFAVQLQAYNTSQMELDPKEAVERKIFAVLLSERVMHDAEKKCDHAECDSNVIDATTSCGHDASTPQELRWCTYDLPPSKAKEVAELMKVLESHRLFDWTMTGPNGGQWSPPSCAQKQKSEMRLVNDAANVALLTGGQGHFGECLGDDYLSQLATSGARARSLEALATAECMEPVPPQERSYTPRHRYQLPAHRARHFATITGAWEHSGAMPAPMSTLSLPSIEQKDSTSTGAMMEFLGGEMGQHLPFRTDTQSSRISLPEPEWSLPPMTLAEGLSMNPDMYRFSEEGSLASPMQADGGAAQISLPDFSPTTLAAVSGMSAEASRFSAEGTSAPPMQAGTACASVGQPPTTTMTNDMTTGAFDYNIMDIDFEGVFDMPLDETFS